MWNQETPFSTSARLRAARLLPSSAPPAELGWSSPQIATPTVSVQCSGTGTLARHPEIRWRLRPEQLSEFHQLQVGILASAIKQLALGGRLVYSTCSMEPEENEEVVSEVLSSVLTSVSTSAPSIKPVAQDEIVKSLAPHLAPGLDPQTLIEANGQFRTSPAAQHTDGFFAAVLENTGATKP
jgi:16S rRNA (cytosine967-C5)-methyltransferase